MTNIIVNSQKLWLRARHKSWRELIGKKEGLGGSERVKKEVDMFEIHCIHICSFQILNKNNATVKSSSESNYGDLVNLILTI